MVSREPIHVYQHCNTSRVFLRFTLRLLEEVFTLTLKKRALTSRVPMWIDLVMCFCTFNFIMKTPSTYASKCPLKRWCTHLRANYSDEVHQSVQEFQPKTRSFEATVGMVDKMGKKKFKTASSWGVLWKPNFLKVIFPSILEILPMRGRVVGRSVRTPPVKNPVRSQSCCST